MQNSPLHLCVEPTSLAQQWRPALPAGRGPAAQQVVAMPPTRRTGNTAEDAEHGPRGSGTLEAKKAKGHSFFSLLKLLVVVRVSLASSFSASLVISYMWLSSLFHGVVGTTKVSETRNI